MMYSIIRFKSSSCLCLSVTSTAQFTGKTLTVAWAIHTKDGKHLSYAIDYIQHQVAEPGTKTRK